MTDKERGNSQSWVPVMPVKRRCRLLPARPPMVEHRRLENRHPIARQPMQSQDVHPEALSIADRLRTTLLAHFDDRLLGLYLFGSAVIGGYEPGISDVDTVAVLSTDTSDEDIAALAAVHEAVVAKTPEWRDRI